MNKNKVYILIAYLLLTSSGLLYAKKNASYSAVATSDNGSSKIINTLWKEKRALNYRALSAHQLILAESLFEELLKNKINEKTQKLLRDLNLTLTRVDEFILISEVSPPYTGQGIYIIRAESNNNMLIQSPHAYHDLKTGLIAIKLMQENDVKALSINTLPRRYKTPDGNKKMADMAHLTSSLFMVFSRAFANVNSQGRILQLHGFNSASHRRKQALNFIISNGTRAFSQQLVSQQRCIENILDDRVHVYPLDVNELGGTNNSIGKAVRTLGFSGFEHIEMSLQIREKLNLSRTMRNKLIECFSL